MKKIYAFLAFFAFAVVTMASMNSQKQQEIQAELLEFKQFFDGNLQYTIELAEAMPADKYSYKPHEDVRSFGEQLAHIGLSSTFLLDLFVKGGPMPTEEDFAKAASMEKEIGADKEACIQLLKDTFQKVEDTYSNMTKEQKKEMFSVPFDPNKPEFEKSKAFDFVQDHMIHHRGQALVSLRMQGIEAPQYRLY